VRDCHKALTPWPADAALLAAHLLVKRILFADDDEPIRRLVTAVLKRRGYDVETAADGQEAIEKLDRSDFDVLVLDFMMPRVTGIGVIEHLRRSKPSLLRNTILVTAFVKAASQASSTCRVLAKPFEVDDFVKAVDELAAA
jgi:CheY-like chemotaxis protein